MFEASSKQSPFEKLLDTIKNNAVARGADIPAWQDAWIALTQISEFSNALHKRGVSTTDLAAEINYISRFNSTLLQKKPPSLSERKKIKEIAQELLKDLGTYDAVVGLNLPREDIAHAVSAFSGHVNAKLSALTYAFDIDPEKRDHLNLKRQVANQTIIHAAESVISNLFIKIDAEDNPGAIIDLKRMVIDAFKETLKDFTFDFSAYYEQPQNDKIVESLTGLQKHPINPPSPVELIDYMIAQSGAVYDNLLYRNGLRSNDPDKIDALDGLLPARETQDVMLSALSTAYDLKSKKLATRHVALALLELPSTRIHLGRVGIKDLIKFEDDLRKNSVDLDPKTKGRISVHPDISDDIRALANKLDKSFGEDGRGGAEALFNLIRGDKEISKAFTKAGLSRRVLKEWDKAYDKKKGKTDEEDKEKKDGFKIPEAVLETYIKEYCIDQTKLARDKKYDPMIGNEGLLDQITTKLLKRGRKNPIVIGEPGVGKSKILEGLSQSILKGTVPEELVGARLLSLDLNQMNDTPYKGVFEERILTIIKGIAERNAAGSGGKILLALDEFAETQGAGGHMHSSGFKGIIKPYLTSGDIFLIANATENEYRTKIEKDPALARRLQPVFMVEPTVAETTLILKGIKPKHSKHHKLRIPNALMADIAELSDNFIHTAKQPDKALDLLDEACALARKSQAITLSLDHIHTALSSKTGISVNFLSQNDNTRYANANANIKTRVWGQDEAIESVTASLKRAKAGFRNGEGPIGNYLFVGPTGVGKTELTKALAEFLFGSEKESLVRFDMSEYMEKTAANRFLGAAPGYVGYEEGGELVKALRRKSHGVYLYDEGEKAHPDVFNALLAPFSDGIVTDGRGMSGSMRHVLNVITTNLGGADVWQEGKKRGLDPLKDHKEWQRMARPIYERAVQNFFRPEFLNRLDGIIYFNSLTPEIMNRLVTRHFNSTAGQLRTNYGLELELAPLFKEEVAKAGFDVSMGARPLKRAWEAMVETPLADWLLTKNMNTVRRSKRLLMDVKEAIDFDRLLADNPDEKDIQSLIRESGKIMPKFQLMRT